MMTQRRTSIFRTAMQVSPERIAAMGDTDLTFLMGELLRAQAYKCGSPPSEIRINTDDKAKDDGSDGWSSKGSIPDDWLGSVDTCWQFKAGSAGYPARLAGEVTKRIPKETLKNGGRFVVVASASTNGKKGESDRLAKLKAGAAKAGIKNGKIEVIGSERLTIWCNQHPAIAARWAGHPDGLWTFDDWSNSDQHQVPWQASAAVQSEIAVRREDIDFGTGNIYHLHIKGPPGVGKTRFALELCRGAAWRSSVIYIRQASDLRLAELIDGAAGDHHVQLVVVADEVQPEQLQPLRDSVGRADGRVRLITAGHSPSPDPTRIPVLSVKPLEDHAMQQVIKGWYPAMPPEHIDFVVRFADGYIRLARLAADAVALDPTMNVRRLLSRDEIRSFLDKMLGTGERHALYVVAVLTRVGWTDDLQIEGESIAKHFGRDWNSVRATVDDFDRRLGIVPRGGRYRYISPTPLGVHLAVEAWTTYPDLLKSLPGALPSNSAMEAYYERLQMMVGNVQARKFARDQLAFFFRIDHFGDARAVRRWSALSSADPDQAAGNILQALRGTSIVDRARIKHDARREIVWTLVRLAWRSSSFHDATMALALLAEAENETWATNASGEFLARFQIFLAGTAVPYLDRLSVIDELLAEQRPLLTALAVKALAQVGNDHASRDGSSPVSDEVPEKEWQPNTGKEHLECVETSITRLSDIAQRGLAGIESDLIAAAKNLSMMLREKAVRDLVANFFETVRSAYPSAREPLRRTIAEFIHRERKYWKTLSDGELEELERLHSRFEDTSLGARLQQHIGESSWDREEELDLKPLAKEILLAKEDLVNHWPWLTSGEAWDAWKLGEALASVDNKGELAEILPLLPGAGPDLRLLCGYVNTRRQSLGDDWYTKWVTSQFGRDPKPIGLLFEVASRCGVTEAVASMIIEILRTEPVNSQVVAQLAYGRWHETLSFEILEKIVQAMMGSGHSESAIRILYYRMRSNRDEAERWWPLALKLVTVSQLIRSRNSMVSHVWEEVAKRIVGTYPGELATAIFREQADRKSGTWFAEHSQSVGVLHACVEQDPRMVWQALKIHISSRQKAYIFSIGFPRGVLDRMPADDVGAWIAEKAEERAAVVARLASKDFSGDETLASRIIGEYGDIEGVGGAFFSEYVSGVWSGPASSHWDQLAASLDEIARRTKLSKLRRWARNSARSLRGMAERDRQREDEEELGAR
jgi:hypothetical protein